MSGITLDKPPWNPLDWAFAPVWTFLYILMGVAAWSVWRLGWERPGVPVALGLFAVQLALDLLWSLLFFGLHAVGLALVEIAVLWAFILATTVQFYGLNAVSGVLLLPYLAWVTFAAVLNTAVWSLNR